MIRRNTEVVTLHGLSTVQKAYRRGDFFAHRVPLMDDWAAYCTTGVLPEGWTK
jgi:hypothetical protein